MVGYLSYAFVETSRHGDSLQFLAVGISFSIKTRLQDGDLLRREARSYPFCPLQMVPMMMVGGLALVDAARLILLLLSLWIEARFQAAIQWTANSSVRWLLGGDIVCG